MEEILFYVLASLLVGFAILTVTARNPVRSALYLISALLAVAGLFLLLEAEFVAAVQVLVYVGGIMVLFLFVILLVSVRKTQSQSKVSRQWKTALALTLVLSAELGFLVIKGARMFQAGAEPLSLTTPQARSVNTESVAGFLYGPYMLPFEIASVLLLVAIVGAVVLSKRQT